jgi:ABC-type uncharacterized transport system permease subunit
MLELPLIEKIIYISVVSIFAIGSVVGFLHLSPGGGRYRRLLALLIAFGLCLELVMLVLRGVALKTVPLTGLFETMMVLTLVLGVTYLFLSMMIKQVWFGSVMAWLIFLLSVLSGIVAKPASQLQPEARTPWVIFHALSMTMSGTFIVFAGAMAVLFLLCRRRLKRKQIAKVLGRMPNIERLERLNILGLRWSFVLMTFGLVSGIGVAIVRSDSLAINSEEWLSDSKIIIVAVAWLIIGAILLLKDFTAIKAKAVAQMTLIAVFMTLFAIVGSTVFCGSAHDFSSDGVKTIEADK